MKIKQETITWETKAVVDRPPWSLRRTELTAMRLVLTFNVRIRKAWERLRHQVSHFGHLQYHPVTFSDTEMVRSKDTGPCCWRGKLNTRLSPLSPSESYLGSHEMTNSWLWGSSFPSLDCSSYWETFLYTGYLHLLYSSFPFLLHVYLKLLSSLSEKLWGHPGLQFGG